MDGVEETEDLSVWETDQEEDEEHEVEECREDDGSDDTMPPLVRKNLERTRQALNGSKKMTKPEATTAADLADEYLIQRGYRSLQGLGLRKHHGEWLRYDGQIFRSLGGEELEADITMYLRESSMRAKADAYVHRIVNQLSALCLIPEATDLPARYESEEWITERETIVLQNGVINLGDYKERLKIGLPPRIELLRHDPKLVSRILLPFEYDPNATYSGWMQFLEQILPDPESRLLLQQMFGYCLTPDISQQKFFMFEGTGGNGKGVVTNILARLLGPENVSALPVSRFGAPHELEVTLGRLVNITSEMKEKDTLAEDLLKQFVAGDRLHFNPKHRKPFPARPAAKLILSTNERPMFTDRSDGIWRRLMILPFPVTIPEAERDVYLEEKLAKELPGILNWAVAGLCALYKRGAFQEPQVSIAAREEFRRESNAARMFLEEMCWADKEGEIEREELYHRYEEYLETTARGGCGQRISTKRCGVCFPRSRRYEYAGRTISPGPMSLKASPSAPLGRGVCV